MATSGSVDSGGYQGRVLRFEWSTQSTSGNIRKISYKVTAVGGSSSIYYHHNEVIKINGTTIYTGADSHAVTTGDVLVSDTMDINQSVTTTLTIQMNGGIYERSDNINTTKSWTLDTLITAPTITSLKLKSRTLNSLTFEFTCTKADTFYYKLSTDSAYKRGTSGNITSGTFTITGLTPNKSYTINFIARNWISESPEVYRDAEQNVTGTTYEIGQISSVGNFNHGNNASVVITNPSGSALSLVMKIGSTAILTKSVSAGTNTINFTDAQLDSIYKLYGSSNILTATFVLTTASSYTNSKTCTITLTGNQKTAYIGANGKKRAKVYVGVNGTVKRAVVWIGNNGRKRCI